MANTFDLQDPEVKAAFERKAFGLNTNQLHGRPVKRVPIPIKSDDLRVVCGEPNMEQWLINEQNRVLKCPHGYVFRFEDVGQDYPSQKLQRAIHDGFKKAKEEVND